MPQIAVVDNDTILLDLMDEVFAEKGWDTLSHADGSTACQVLRDEHPDVILLDIWLESSLSGWEVLHNLKVDPVTRPIPVIVWSGALDQLGDKRAWLAAQGIAALTKPFDLEELYAVVDAALHRQVLDRERV